MQRYKNLSNHKNVYFQAKNLFYHAKYTQNTSKKHAKYMLF